MITMTLNKLLDQHSLCQRKLDEAEQSAKSYREKTGQLKEQIEAKVDSDFSEFLKKTFPDLPEEQQITEWFVAYRSHPANNNSYIKVGVTKIGGEAKWAGHLGDFEGPLPEHLKEVKSFGSDYPIDIRVSHVYEVDDIK